MDRCLDNAADARRLAIERTATLRGAAGAGRRVGSLQWSPRAPSPASRGGPAATTGDSDRYSSMNELRAASLSYARGWVRRARRKRNPGSRAYNPVRCPPASKRGRCTRASLPDPAHRRQAVSDLAHLPRNPGSALLLGRPLGLFQAGEDGGVVDAVSERLPGSDLGAFAPVGRQQLRHWSDVSRYSAITRESNTAPPSSMMRHGTLPSGLASWILLSGDHTSSRSR
jgi:hypothetical protein